MQILRSLTLANSGQAAAQLFVCGWAGEKRVAERAHVKPGPSGQDWRTTARFDFSALCRRLAGPIAGGVVNFGWNKINKVMRHALTFGKRNFGSSDLNALINL